MKRKNIHRKKIIFLIFNLFALLSFFIIFISTQNVHAQKSGAWEIKTPLFSIEERFGHTISWVETYEILAFGWDGAQKMYNDLYSYNNGEWTPEIPTNNAPPKRANHCAWYLNGKLYVHAGKGEAQLPLNDLWNYDPTTKEWTQITHTNPSPSARYNHKANTMDDGSVIISGGYDGSFSLNDIWKYNFNTNTWIQVSTTLPIASESHVAEVVDNEMYIFTTGQGYKYNLTTNTWTSGLQAPPIRGGATSAIGQNLLGQKIIFIFGGVNMANNFSDKVYEYNTETGILTEQTEPTPVPVYGTAAAKINSSKDYAHLWLVFFGGVTGSWSSITLMGQTWEYEIGESLSVDVSNKNQSFYIFPNPAKEAIQIYLYNYSKVISIEILDMHGKLLIKKQLLSDSKIDISELSAGAYTLRVFSENDIYIKKIIIL